MAEQADSTRGSAFALALLMFAVGACMMCVEIVSGMTIAPYFGSNVFVWGGVIGVFMGALSLGYVLGGRAADAQPGPWLLSALTFAAGALLMAVPFAVRAVCDALLASDWGPALNPLRLLVALVALYFLPTMFLGMVSPVAVRVASTALSSVGRVVGRLYALNAFGSVVGTLVGAFVLVPLFGVRAILFGCGAALVVVAVACHSLRPGVSAPAAAPLEHGAEAKPLPGLRPLVFGVGLVFMSLEVIAGAEIAPYFGSSVFVWGSVIALFLLALSTGYRLGGRLADRRPTMMALATVLVAAGIATLLIPLITPSVCRAFAGPPSGGLGRLRSLPVTVILYFVPTVLFAMTAPFAVRLSATRLGRVGGVAGRLYALSTLGNLVGALLTTYVLIRVIGKTRLFEAAGFATVLMAVFAVFVDNRARGEKRQPLLVSALLLVAAGALAFACPKPPLVPLVDQDEAVIGSVVSGGQSWYLIKERPVGSSEDGLDDLHFLRRIRAEFESPYHHVAVIEDAVINSRVLGPDVFGEGEVTTADGRKIPVKPTAYRGNRRDLKFDRYIESSLLLDDRAAGIRRPYTSKATYADLLHLPFVFNPRIRDVLIVGGGGGVVPTIFRESYPAVSIDVVEIDPVVVAVAEKWFDLKPDEERLRVHVQDGRMYIHNSKGRFDLIILDAYTAGGRVPFHLTTKEFLTEVRDHLKPDGIALMNVISAVGGPSSKLFRAEYKTFNSVFGAGHVYVFPKNFTRGFDEEGVSRNIILIATGEGYGRRLDRAEILDEATRLVGDGTIPIRTVRAHAANMFTDEELGNVPQDDVPVLTDDYAPVDIMTVD